MHDGEANGLGQARRLLARIRENLRPRVVMGGLWHALLGCGAFINSRRWLIGSLLISGVLVGLVFLAHPSTGLVFPFSTSQEREIPFDDVKYFPAGPATPGVRFLPMPGDEIRTAEESPKPGTRPALEAAASPENAKPGASLELSRRLDAVRSREARGAWLTGSIRDSSRKSAAGANAAGDSGQGAVIQDAARPMPERVVQ